MKHVEYPAPPPARERRVIGHGVTRIEDRPLVTGQGAFAGDINFPRQIHMRVVRSAHAHGRILGIDAEAARDTPGVVAVWTHDDIADLPPIDFRDPTAEVLKPYRQPVLAAGRVRYVGDPVAAVFAEDPYLAEDAAERVAVDVEPLDVVVDAAGATGWFGDGLGSEPIVVDYSYGDIAAAFAAAAEIVELDLAIGRHSGVPMETRGAIGRYDARNDILELFGAAKVPHRNRETLVRMLKRPPASIHLHEGNVGGGFGIRGELYPEDVLVLVAAMRLGRPVKWIEDRREHMMAANQSRQQRHVVRAAVDASGRLLGLDAVIYHDQGAYVRTHAARVVGRTMSMLPGPYRIPAYRASGRYRLTNKTPAATYRAPGRYEGTFVRERLMDAVAERLGIDRVEIRRRNLIPGEAMPCTIAFDQPGAEALALDSGDYPALLEAGLRRFGWDELQAEIRGRREAGEAVGLGVATFLEESGRGPADGARVSVDTSGTVEVLTGGASVGQGFATIMAQIAAEALGVAYGRIRVIHGQTDRIPYGIGAHAARATVLTGNAVHVAATNLRRKALEVAAEILQTPADLLAIVDGTIRRNDVPAGPSISLGDLARRMAPGSEVLGDRDPGLSAEGWFNTDETVFPYGAHFAVVRVDRDTGQAVVERFLIAYDVGRAINPLLVEGQLVGACVQGLGGALLEEFTYSETGEPLAVTFADYLIPTASEVPPIDCLIAEDAPSPRNPLGVKGAGEGGINAVGAVVASAIDDALGIPGAVTRLPVTPRRVREILRAQAGGAPG
ncbi:xanthine dehydrogenase family protein molybdopterin-binding subunit [Propylenella binzhouense]|uniref:Xanthine dehydrogenase family protein molybdopterin-binding subunit n=1 Tax=Propylenella binzhouense TaxID=2555902 RepID=A0A964T4V1_9HYPH|nr:xanthine dehydrogenase family protein molybdopterin-binding subunit [Propylenella binzhouense]MYZ48190.1 xanthine dehydrogenase family protein molybdopterin-binding subunit [Propylenella binzhouense]